MTSFFVPGTTLGGGAQGAYDALRDSTARRTGGGVRTTRIYSLNNRRNGRDSLTRVGEPDPVSGGTVSAIFATASGYTVTWDGGHADLKRHQIYEAEAFD